jgi:tetratricopeptide (TPR) repeat protein
VASQNSKNSKLLRLQRFACLLIVLTSGALCYGQVVSPEQAEQNAREHPQSAEAQNVWGESLAENSQFTQAREAFEHAVALKPNYGSAYLNLGLVSLQLHDAEKGATSLDRAIQLLGNSPEAGYALYVRAKIYNDKNQHEKVLQSLKRAVVLRPDLPAAWSDLGEAKRIASDPAGALAAFQKAVDLDPQDGVAQYRLGAELLRQNKLAPAVEHLRIAYQRNPKDQSTLNAFQTALRKDGKDAEANQVRADLAKQLRDRDTAMQNAVAAVKLNNQGAELEKQGDLNGALAKYKEALNLNPDHVGVRINYAVALLRTGQWTDGLNQMHEALKRDPGNQQLQTAFKDAISQAPPNLVPKWDDSPH